MLPLKTVTASVPVFMTPTCAIWLVVLEILTDRGQAAMAAPAKAAIGRMFGTMIESWETFESQV